jgi:hypothetical protein
MSSERRGGGSKLLHYFTVRFTLSQPELHRTQPHDWRALAAAATPPECLIASDLAAGRSLRHHSSIQGRARADPANGHGTTRAWKQDDGSSIDAIGKLRPVKDMHTAPSHPPPRDHDLDLDLDLDLDRRGRNRSSSQPRPQGTN